MYDLVVEVTLAEIVHAHIPGVFSQCEGPVGRVDYFDASAVVLLQPLKEPLAEHVSAAEFSIGSTVPPRRDRHELYTDIDADALKSD